MWRTRLATVLLALAPTVAANASPAGSTGGAITEPTVTNVRYACRMGTGFTGVARDPKAPVFVVRVVVGERVLYELYAKPRDGQVGAVLLATCDYLVPTAEPAAQEPAPLMSVRRALPPHRGRQDRPD